MIARPGRIDLILEDFDSDLYEQIGEIADSFSDVSDEACGRALRRLLFALGAAWTLPNTLIGLAGGLAGMVAGARPRWSRTEMAIVFVRWPWGPGCGWRGV